MTHFIKNSEYEIIEQLANGNWVVLDVNTGQIREISDYYLRNIHQDDYDQKGREMAAWIAVRLQGFNRFITGEPPAVSAGGSLFVLSADLAPISQSFLFQLFAALLPAGFPAFASRHFL